MDNASNVFLFSNNNTNYQETQMERGWNMYKIHGKTDLVWNREYHQALTGEKNFSQHFMSNSKAILQKFGAMFRGFFFFFSNHHG